jgi:hypothetical protein
MLTFKSIASCRRHRATACIGIALAAGAMMVPAAQATENGGTTYPIGVFTINPGFAPPSDPVSFFSYNSYFSSHTLESTNPRKPTDFSVWSAASAERFDFTYPIELGDGIHLGSRVIVPLVDVHQSVVAGGVSRSQSKTGVGDILFAPLLIGKVSQTSLGVVAQQANLTISLPTGSYHKNDLVNLGHNFTAWQWNYGVSWLPTAKTNLGFQAVYISNQKNHATNYKSGDEFDVDWVAGVMVAPRLWVEANGYYYKQISRDLQNGLPFNNGNYGKTLGFGPQVRMTFPHGGGITMKWQHETDVENRARGNRYWIQVYIPLARAQHDA